MARRPHVGGARWPGAVRMGACVRPAVAGLALGAVSFGLSGVTPAAAQAPVADGAFTADQAAGGWSVYGTQCEECHGPALEGMVHAPPLSGVDFPTGFNAAFEAASDGDAGFAGFRRPGAGAAAVDPSLGSR